MNERLKNVAIAGTLLFAGCSSHEAVGSQDGSAVTLQPIILSPLPETPTTFVLPETTIPPETSTTLTATTLLPGVAKPECVTEIKPGDSLFSISQKYYVSIPGLQTENRIEDPDKIRPGLLDICVDEKNDITGEPRVPVTTTIPADSLPPESQTTATIAALPEKKGAPRSPPTGVKEQQLKANQLLGPYGMPPLEVDGIPGSLTDQQICALRVALNLPISREDMVPGSAEEGVLMSAESLAIPDSAAIKAAKWMLIDQTCQITILGDGSTGIAYVFPSSTGMAEFPTRNGKTAAFRYDPAVLNDGWHDSSAFPAGEDNPLNGNMYKPVYFSMGQATHGALNVPTYPASHGCNRLSVADQEILIGWLGLAGIQEETWKISRIGLTVTVQGVYQ